MPKLSKIDRRILEILQRDSSITNVALAEQINMSPSPCLRRVKYLEEKGFIRGYVALLDRQQLELGLVAFVEVKVPQVPGKDIVKDFTDAVLSEPSIISCFMTAGQYDFLLKVVSRDLTSYSQLAQRLLRLPGVQDLRSSFVLDAIKDTTELPLPET